VAKVQIKATVTRKMSKKKTERVPAPTEKALKLTKMKSDTDVNGSYTGNPKKGERPVQDADDL
jgi:hypothetical protein